MELEKSQHIAPQEYKPEYQPINNRVSIKSRSRTLLNTLEGMPPKNYSSSIQDIHDRQRGGKQVLRRFDKIGPKKHYDSTPMIDDKTLDNLQTVKA